MTNTLKCCQYISEVSDLSGVRGEINLQGVVIPPVLIN